MGMNIQISMTLISILIFIALFTLAPRTPGFNQVAVRSYRRVAVEKRP